MALDPYDQYLSDSRKKLTVLRRQAQVRARRGQFRRSRFGRGWSRHAKTRAEEFKSRLNRADQPLALRTRREIRLMATGNTNRAFAPAEQELNVREKRARDSAEKRRIDDQYFAQWQNDQLAKMDAQARAGQDALLARQREITAAQTADQAGHVNQVARETAAAPGSVTSAAAIAGSDAAKGVQAQDQLDRSQLQIQQTRTNAQIASGTDTRNLGRAAAFLSQQAENVSRLHDLFKQLQDVTDARGQLVLKKASAANDEVARLLDNNVKIAQSQQELQLAGIKLGVQQQKQQFDQHLATSKFHLDVKKFKHQLSQDQIRNALRKLDEKIKSGHLTVAQQNAAEKQRHDLATELISRRKGSGKGAKADKKQFEKSVGIIRSAKDWETRIGSHGWRVRYLNALLARGISRRAAQRAVTHVYKAWLRGMRVSPSPHANRGERPN